jgi:hypothetical protein
MIKPTSQVTEPLTPTRSSKGPLDTSLVLEVPRALWSCPRVGVAEALTDWLGAPAQCAELGLPPDEIIVGLHAGRRLRATHQVGRFVVFDQGVWSGQWYIEIAFGREADEDEIDLQSRLETIPHELVHLARFARQFGGRTPAQVAQTAHEQGGWAAISAAFRPWEVVDREGDGPDSPEAIGRALTGRFLGAYRAVLLQTPKGQRAACRLGCGCRARPKT